jgi:hypothetical protein
MLDGFSHAHASGMPERLSQERRRSPRIEILGQIHGEVVSLDLPILLREVSFGGFSAETPIQFPLGVAHAFRFSPAGEEALILTARVTYSRPAAADESATTYITGFEFAHKHAQTRESVDELIDKITSVLNID